MKKLFNVFLFLCVAAFAFAMTATEVHAEGETVTSTLTIHYAKQDLDYEHSGLHSWGFGNSDTHKGWPVVWDETDEFGGKLTLTIDSAASEQIGLIALKTLPVPGGWNGNVKSVEHDLFFPTSLLTAKGGAYEHLDIYMINGGENYVIAYPDRVNIMVGYYDPSGAYEEHLGVHIWGAYTGSHTVGYSDDGKAVINEVDVKDCQWATPKEVFADGMASDSGNVGKIAMLYAEPGQSVGGLIYAGDDATKKYSSDVWNGIALEAGALHQAFVSNGKLYNSVAEFISAAFTFRFKGFGTDDKGNFTGTYAPNPTSIIVVLDSAVSYPEVTEGEDLGAKLATRFTLNEVTVEGETVTKGAEVAIKQVDYNKSVTSASEFVIQLEEASKLDNTKHYVLTYSERAEAETEAEASKKNYGEIEVDLDREAPVIVVGAVKGEIPYGKLFSFDLMPIITVTDNRDAEVSYYCVEGDESTLDTGKPGEQKVKIYATDSWGNVAVEYITFTVSAAPSAGCSKGAVVVALSALAAASAAFIVLRKRNA